MMLFPNIFYDNSILGWGIILVLFLSLLLIYFFSRNRGILVQIGGVLIIMFTLVTLIIGNLVTVSAFSSYLKTIHDRNEAHLKEIMTFTGQYKALPWLVGYWTTNAAAISKEFPEESANVFEGKYGSRPEELTEEDILRMTPEEQYAYAKLCYDRIDYLFEYIYTVHNLDELFLIMLTPEDKAVIIFDAKKNPDGSAKLGQYKDLTEEMAEWTNYAETVEPKIMPWTWGRYNSNDDFGFYEEFQYDDNSDPLLLCNSFKRSEVYEHLSFISGFRTRALVLMVLSALVILIMLYLKVLRPISAIEKSVMAYQKDKDADKVRQNLSVIKSQNEIGAFAKEFSMLAQEMDEHTRRIAKLAREKERVSTELRMASEIQSSVLPSVFPAFPDHGEFDIYASMVPAREISGDFYDFFLIGQDRLAFLVGDVSDKGVPSALFMMSVKNLINYCAQGGGSLVEILSSVNTHLCKENSSAMFVTVWMGILDLNTGDLTYAGGGHEAPAMFENGKFAIHEEAQGPVLGIFPDAGYTEHTIRLAPGDAIFIYTDGVLDAQAEGDRFYGPERMLKKLNEESSASPEKIISSVSEDIKDFVKDAEQFDDITMLCLRFIRCR